MTRIWLHKCGDDLTQFLHTNKHDSENLRKEKFSKQSHYPTFLTVPSYFHHQDNGNNLVSIIIVILVLKLSLAHPRIPPSNHNGNPNTHREFLIELISQEGVGQLPKVELAEGAHTVDVLEVHFPCQIWTLI